MRLAAVLVVLMLLSGCAAKQHEPGDQVADSDRWRKTDEAVVKTLSEGVRNPRNHAGITHVVLLWLKTPGDPAAIEKIVRTSREFREIPGVLAVHVGRPVPSTRPVVDSSFDVGLAMSFGDEAALQAYEAHPQHVKAVREVLRPLAAKIQVYDIKEAVASPAPASK
ncbi:MAG: hypothetical protein QOF78_370 [Phycisphaerales bacterium]|nr:hypothetical protein [Phycisphaerales bacterium]